MLLDMHDPVIHIACDRLGVTEKNLNVPPISYFQDKPNPKILHYEASHIMLEINKMRQKGITEAEWIHAGSPTDFPFKVFTNKGKPVKAQKTVEIENRFEHVMNLEKQKIQQVAEYLNKQDARSLKQQDKNKKQQQFQSQYLNQVYNDAIKTAENVIEGDKQNRSNLRQSLTSKDKLREYYMQQNQQHLDDNRQMNSSIHAQKILTANIIVNGIETERQIQRQAINQQQKQYIQERCQQKEVLLNRVVDANQHHSQLVEQHCKNVRISDKLKQQQKQNNLQVQQYNTGQHIQLLKEQKDAENTTIKILRDQYLKDKYQQFKEIEQIKKDCKILKFQTKDEISQLNLTGTGAKIVKDRQIVATMNQIQDQKSQQMRNQIKANVEYKKNIYEQFKGDVPFKM